MRTIRSETLRRSLEDVLRVADGEPVLLLHREQPRYAIMSSEEFVRLKVAAGEVVTQDVMKSTVTFDDPSDDPLGFDTSDFMEYARRASETALSGSAVDYSDAEVEGAERRWGFR